MKTLNVRPNEYFNHKTIAFSTKNEACWVYINQILKKIIQR